MAAVAGLGIPAVGMILYFYYYKKNGGKTYSDIEE
jgi:hypothetical protein